MRELLNDAETYARFVKAAFKSGAGLPPYMYIWCPDCASLVGLGTLPAGGSVSKCEHEDKLLQPFREFASKH